MLQRLVQLSQGVANDREEGVLKPLQTLDGRGRLGEPPATSRALTAAGFADARVGPTHPPGFYGDQSARRALNLASGFTEIRAIETLPTGALRRAFGEAGETDLKPWLLAAALVLALVDLIASLALRGLLPAGLGRATAALAVLVLGGAPAAAQQDDDFVLAATLDTRLAYVMTGDDTVDAISRSGLEGLGVVLTARTSIEPQPPMAINIERDELIFFPLIYWPVAQAQPALSPKAAVKVNHYLKTGGIIMFDTRDQNVGPVTMSGGLRPGARRLRALLADLAIPPLIPVPADHVLTRAFYLMRDFPGRWTGGQLWVERHEGGVNDGVSSLVIGSHDWAGGLGARRQAAADVRRGAGRRASARDGVPFRRQSGDVCDDRQLQGRPGPPAGDSRTSRAMSESLTTIAFGPIVPWPLVAGFALVCAAGVALGLARRAHGIWWRALGFAAAVLALLNPLLVEESRERLADVAVVVVDQSASQDIGARAAQSAAAVEELKQALGSIDGLELRVVAVGGARARDGEAPASGTALFAALRRAVSDVPRRRVAGAIMITDGRVHDVPEGIDALGFEAPVHVLLSGMRDEADRRLVVEQAPRYGIVGNMLKLVLRVEDSGAGGQRRDLARLTMRIDDGAAAHQLRAGRRRPRDRVHPRPRGRHPHRARGRGRAGRAQPRQQSGRGRGEWSARPAARAADLGRGPYRRAGVAQPPQGGPVGRSRALHHSQAAREAGRDADPRARVDLVSDPRSFRDQAQRVRPHHLRPLSPARAWCR